MAKPEDKQEEQLEQQTPETATVVEIVEPIKVKTLNMIDCTMIREIGSRRLYDNTTPDSRNYGKYYRTFRYMERSFTVQESDKFCKDYDKENLEQVRLTKSELSEKGWDFQGHLSITQGDKIAETTHKRAGYAFASLKREKMLDPEDFD